MERGPKRVRCADWSAEETNVLVECTKAAFLKGEKGTAVWRQIANTFSHRLGDKCQARSFVQCRRRWDTLKKAYIHIKNYCIQTGQDHRELDEDELESMHLATAYREDWYSMVEYVCTHCKTKQIANLLPEGLSPLPLALTHREDLSIIVKEVCSSPKGEKKEENFSEIPIHKKKNVHRASHEALDPDSMLGSDAQCAPITSISIPDLLAPVLSSGNLDVDTSKADHQDLPAFHLQIPRGPILDAEIFSLLEENQKLKKEIETMKAERLQQQNQTIEKDLQVKKRSNLDHPIEAMAVESGGKSNSFEILSYSKIFSNSISELCRLPELSASFNLQLSTSNISQLWHDMEDLLGGSCTSPPKPQEYRVENHTNST